MGLQDEPVCGVAATGDGAWRGTRQCARCADLCRRRLFRRQAGSDADGFLRGHAFEKDRPTGETGPHHGRSADYRTYAPSDEDLAPYWNGQRWSATGATLETDYKTQIGRE